MNLNAQQCQFLLENGFNNNDVFLLSNHLHSKSVFTEIKTYLESKNKPVLLNAREIMTLVESQGYSHKNLHAVINHYPTLSNYFAKDTLLKWGSHSRGSRYIEAVSNNLDALFSLGLTADNIDYLNSTYSGYKKIECIPRYFPALLAKNYALKDLIALLAQNEGVKKIQCLSVGSRPTTPYSLKLIDTLIALYQQPPIEESKMLETDELIEWRGFKFANLLNKAITIDLIQSSLGSYSYQIFVKNKEKLTEWFLSQGIIFPVQSANTNNIQSLIQLFSDNSNIATEVINNNAINFDDLSMFFLDDVNDSSLCETNIVSNFAQEIQNFESHLVVDSHDQEHQSPINDTPSNKSIIEENSFLLNTGFDEEDIRVIRKHYKSTLLFAEIKKYFDSENKPIVLNAKEIMGLFRFPRSVSRNLSQFIDAYPALSTHFSKDILLKWVSHLMGYKNIEAVSNNLDALFSLGLTAADISYLNSKTTGYHKIECIPFYFPALLAKKYALNDLIAVLAQIGGDKKIKDLYKGKCPTTNWPAQLIESLVAVYQNQSTAQFKTPEMDEPIIFKTSKFDTKYHTLFQAVTINPLKSTTGRYSYLFILKNKENLKNWLFLRGIIFPTLTVAPDDTITIDSNNTSEEINNTSEDINDNPVDFDELRALLLSQSNEYSVPYNRACETQTQSLPAPYPDSVSHQVPTTVINNKSTFFYTDKMDTSPQPSTSRRSPQRSNHSVFLFDSPTSGNPASKIRKLDENDTPFGDQRSPKSPQ